MQYRKIRNLLEVALLVERENLVDAIILHYYAVNDVADAGMVFKDALPHVIKELSKVISLFVG
jgi:hypothetical protein